jgi:hypothetical protein
MTLKTLPDRLECPPYNTVEEARRLVWDELLSPRHRTFFRTCLVEKDLTQADPKRPDLGQWLDQQLPAWLSEWDQVGKELKRVFAACELQAVFRAHLLCARSAARKDATLQSAVAAVPVEEVDRLPVGLRWAFVRDLVHEFVVGRPLSHDHVCRIPMALVARRCGTEAGKTADVGVIAEFVLERVLGGCGEVYLAPRQAFLRMAEDFRTAVFGNALEAVRQFLQRDDAAEPRPPFDVRLTVEVKEPDKKEWQLLQTFDAQSGDHFPLEGQSAGGAAALGLYHIFTGKVPDDRVVVITSINEKGEVGPVDSTGVATKVHAIVQDAPQVDTIVVAGEANRAAAADALKSMEQKGRVRVKDLYDSNTTRSG